MGMQLPEEEDTELNMTPMIDIVFQLIIFFLLTLKFKEIDRQIDSNLPKDRGLAATPTDPPEFQKVKIKVFRRNYKKPEAEQYTLVKVDNTHELRLPTGWKGHVEETEDRKVTYDKRIREVLSIVRGKIKAHPGGIEEIKGELVAPPPKGGSVPHEDVMRMLDVFLQANITDVVFEGAATPLTNAEAAALGG